VEVPNYTSLAFVQVHGYALQSSHQDWYDYAEVKLKAGQSITIEGIPESEYGAFNAYGGFCYKVVEVSPDGYSTVVSRQNWDKNDTWDYQGNQAGTSKDGVVEEGPYVQSCIIRKDKNNGNWVKAGVTFTNTLTTRRTLTLTKEVEDDAGYTDDNTFEFEVRLFREGSTRTALSGSFPVEYQKDGVTTGYGTLNFVEKSSLARGVATVSLQSGESIVIKNLPTAVGYEAFELNAEDYETAFDYVTTAGGTGTVSGTSAYSTVDGQTVPYIRVGYATGEGKLALSTTFYNSVHAFTLRKTVKGSEDEKEQDFQFLVTLTDSSGAALTGTYTVESSSTDDALAPNYSSLTFDSNGQAEVTLRHGQAITILGLPSGYIATAQEENVDTTKYTTEAKVDGTVTAAAIPTVSTANSTAHRHEIEFVNKSKNITLSVSKTVNGDANGNDLMQSFLFTVRLYTLTDGSQTPLSSYDKTNLTFDTTAFGVAAPTADDVTITDNGSQTVVRFHPKNGQVVKLGNLPSGTYYTVEEPEPTSGNDQIAALPYYTTTVSYTNSSGQQVTQSLTAKHREISDQLNESCNVTFTNTRASTLTIEKEITENVDMNTSFSFALTLTDSNGNGLNAKYGDVTVVNGKATFSLYGGESVTLTGLPADCVYTVQETNAVDYVATIAITGDDGTVDETNKSATGTVFGGTVVTFTNDQAQNLKPATGIHNDILPAVLLLALALGCALVLTIGKRKRWMHQ
jgi:fibronectin-binding protein 1